MENTATQKENSTPHLSGVAGVLKLAKVMKGIRIAMLTTSDPDGQLRTRPMAAQSTDFDGNLWFLTKKGSGKVSSIENHQQVNLAYVNPADERYVSVMGTATVVDDRKKIKELWTPMMRAWFPYGEDDPTITLIKVTVEAAEIWDAPAGRILELISLAKSALRGALMTGRSITKRLK